MCRTHLLGFLPTPDHGNILLTHKRLQWPTVCFYIQYKIILLVPAWSIPQLIIWPLSSLLSNTKLSDLLTLTCSLSLHIDFSTVRDRLVVWNSFPPHLHAIPHLKTFPWFCQWFICVVLLCPLVLYKTYIYLYFLCLFYSSSFSLILHLI